ncbi:hypothetical protein PHYSODRAFT_485065, partial [Phytophthora sojae]
MDEVAPATDQEARAAEEANAVHEEETAEKLMFAEMYTYLRSEFTGLDLTRAKDVVSAVEYAEAMFQRRSTHDLRNRSLLTAITIRNSPMKKESECFTHTRPLTTTIDHRIAELQVKAGPTSDPWSQKLLSKNEATDNDFLKRICNNASLRVIQNTIKAQVEGDLVLLLQPDFPVYP